MSFDLRKEEIVKVNKLPIDLEENKKKQRNTFVVIDGSSMLTTNYFATLPKAMIFEKDPDKKKNYYSQIMHSKDGTYTNAIYSTLKTIKKIIDNQKPSHIAVVFDKSRNTFRRKLYSEYKAQREETQQPLKEQFILMEQILEEIGIKTFYSSEYEADDYAGSIASQYASNDTRVYLMTKDHDYIQLVNENVHLWLVQTKREDYLALAEKYYYSHGLLEENINLPDKTFSFGPKLIKAEFGYEPKQIIDIKAIAGDASDNIPGIKGIGEKTIIPLIREYGSIENLYAQIDKISIDDKKSVKELNTSWKELGITRSPLKLLKEEQGDSLVGKKAAILSKQLATIKCDIPIKEDLVDFKTNINWDRFKNVCNKLDIKDI